MRPRLSFLTGVFILHELRSGRLRRARNIEYSANKLVFLFWLQLHDSCSYQFDAALLHGAYRRIMPYSRNAHS